MAKLTILTESDQERNSQLHEVAKPVTRVDDSIEGFISDMFDTLKDVGVGLAAPQVGALIRVFIIDMQFLIQMDKGGIVSSSVPVNEIGGVFINPVIKSFSEEQSVLEEKCLSVPSQGVNVIRPVTIETEYYDLDFNKQTLTLTSLTAKVFQHELDHLDGITVLNRGETEWQKEEL